MIGKNLNLILSLLTIITFLSCKSPNSKPVTQEEKIKYLETLGEKDALGDFKKGKYYIKLSKDEYFSNLDKGWMVIYMDLLSKEYNINYINTEIKSSPPEMVYIKSYNNKSKTLIETKFGSQFWKRLQTKAKKQYCDDWLLHEGPPLYYNPLPPFKAKYDLHFSLLDSLFGKGSYGELRLILKVTKRGEVISSDFKTLVIYRDPSLEALVLYGDEPSEDELRGIKRKQYFDFHEKYKFYMNEFIKNMEIEVDTNHFEWVLNDTLRKHIEIEIRPRFYSKNIVSWKKFYNLSDSTDYKDTDLKIFIKVLLDQNGKVLKTKISKIESNRYYVDENDTLRCENSYYYDDSDNSLSDKKTIKKYENLIQNTVAKTNFNVDKNHEYFRYFDTIQVTIEIYSHSRISKEQYRKEVFKEK